MAKLPLPYYPMFAGDFNGSERVIFMTLPEVGLYILLLNLCWVQGSIPDDPGKAAILIHKPERDVRKWWPKVREAFTLGDDGRLTNGRQEVERVRVAEKTTSTDRVRMFRERQKQKTQAFRPVTETSFRPVTETFPSIYSSASVSESQVLYSRYEEFLAAWPEDRRGVDLGAQAWISLVDSREITADSVDEVFAGLERWKASDLWAKGYVPAIAKSDGTGWLQKRAWRDRPAAAKEDSKWS